MVHDKKNSTLKVVENVLCLSQMELNVLAQRLVEDDYAIVFGDPELEGFPKSLYDCFKDVETYRKILDDGSASVKCFVLQSLLDTDNTLLRVPVGVYGHSELYGLRFPLLLAGDWLAFLKMSPTEFGFISGITNPYDCAHYYANILSVRKVLVEKIFQHYADLNAGLVSVMSWAVRGKSSATRLAAEATGFINIAHENHDSFSSQPLNDALLSYVLQSSLRWSQVAPVLGDDANLGEDPQKLNSFLRRLSGYKVDVTDVG